MCFRHCMVWSVFTLFVIHFVILTIVVSLCTSMFLIYLNFVFSYVYFKLYYVVICVINLFSTQFVVIYFNSFNFTNKLIA